jgi:hypothetical protein
MPKLGFEAVTIEAAIARFPHIGDIEFPPETIFIHVHQSGLYFEEMKDGSFFVLVENEQRKFEKAEDAARFLLEYFVDDLGEDPPPPPKPCGRPEVLDKPADPPEGFTPWEAGETPFSEMSENEIRKFLADGGAVFFGYQDNGGRVWKDYYLPYFGAFEHTTKYKAGLITAIYIPNGYALVDGKVIRREKPKTIPIIVLAEDRSGKILKRLETDCEATGALVAAIWSGSGYVVVANDRDGVQRRIKAGGGRIGDLVDNVAKTSKTNRGDLWYVALQSFSLGAEV